MNWRDILKVESAEEKMAATVMSTTAGFESRPRYGKRRRKKDDKEEKD